MLIVERWLLERLRHRTFYSLTEVNAAIGELTTHLNEERPIRRLGVTRRQLLEQVDRPALKSLPIEPYEFSEWRTCRVGIDYHIEVAAHYYSVPIASPAPRLTAQTVEIFLKGERIAAHQRMSRRLRSRVCSALLWIGSRGWAMILTPETPSRLKAPVPSNRGLLFEAFSNSDSALAALSYGHGIA